MIRAGLVVGVLLWTTVGVLPAHGDAAWAAELSGHLTAIEDASGRSEKRQQLREANQLLESLRQDSGWEPNAEEQALLERAFSRGVLSAAMLLGEQARDAGEPEAAFHWFRRAAAQGYPPAMIQVGLMYSNGDGVEADMEKASSWLRPANVKGSAMGKYLLAECFLYGKGVERNPKMAVMLLRESANMENPGRALDLLATCYHKGWGVIRDSEQAAALYGQACDEGFQNACANLAVLFMTGDGAKQDVSAAVALLREGVRLENAMCMFFYGAVLLDGLGDVEPDEKAARSWFKRAAQAGNKPAATWCRQHQVEFTAP